MTGQQLKNSILQMAVQGKLVPQDPNDEPASVLLEKIRKEKEQLVKEGKIKKEKNPSYIFRGPDNLPYEKVGNNEPVCIADEVPFEIPDSWEWARLATLGEIIGGGTPKTNIPEYWDNGSIPWLTPADMKFVTGKYVQGGERCITEKGLKESSAHMMPAGSIVYSSRAPIGYIAIASAGLCTNQGFKSLVPTLMCIDDYIYYCLIAFTPEIQSRASGTTFKEISGTEFGKTLIPLPPLAEQKRIVKAIEKVLPHIKDYEEKHNQLSLIQSSFPEALKKSILQEAIQGKLVPQDPNDEPACVLLERIRAEKQKLIKEGKIKKDKHESIIFRRDNSYYEKLDGVERCIDDELPFKIPEGWEWIHPTDIGYFGSGKTPKSNQLVESGSIPYFKVADMNSAGNEIVLHNSNNFLKTPHSYNLFSKGSIVYPKNGGAVFTNKKRILGQDSLVDLNTGCYTPFSQIDKRYLYYLFSTVDFQKYYKGTALPTVDMDAVKKIVWGLPPLKEQKRIADQIDCLQQHINNL